MSTRTLADALGGLARLPLGTGLAPGHPVPGYVSLGTHAVVDVAGGLRFGQALRGLLPMVRDEELRPDVAGIRPRLQRPSDPVRDFVLAEESGRGLPGLVNLVGTESPGQTAALAIAREVERLLG